MSEPLKSRIVVTEHPSGKRTVQLVDPHSGRVLPTGITAQGQDETDVQVHRVKDQLERAGHRVTVKENKR